MLFFLTMHQRCSSWKKNYRLRTVILFCFTDIPHFCFLSAKQQERTKKHPKTDKKASKTTQNG